jgi:hypothetical protein
MKERWDRGREVMQQTVEFMRAAKDERALSLLDDAIAEAVQEHRDIWVSILCGHAAVISNHIGDRRREIHYNQLRLPMAKDYAFAAYNFAQLLLSDGQVARAEQYASEAYKLSITKDTEADRDLVAAILKQWPSVTQNG